MSRPPFEIPGLAPMHRLPHNGAGELWQAVDAAGQITAVKLVPLETDLAVREYRCVRKLKSLRHDGLLPILDVWLLDPRRRPVAAHHIPQAEAFLFARNFASVPGAMLAAVTPLPEKNLQQRLAECLREGRSGLPTAELLGYLDVAAEALDHLAGVKIDLGQGPLAVVHGDLKPASMVLLGGKLKIADFGLARPTDGNLAVTSVIGSPAYLAPEVIAEKRATLQTDQYSLAISYYELRTGELPFADEIPFNILQAHVNSRLLLGRLSPAEKTVISKATARRPDNRYPNCATFVRELRAAIEGKSSAGTAPNPIPGQADIRAAGNLADMAAALTATAGMASSVNPSGARPALAPAGQLQTGQPQAGQLQTGQPQTGPQAMQGTQPAAHGTTQNSQAASTSRSTGDSANPGRSTADSQHAHELSPPDPPYRPLAGGGLSGIGGRRPPPRRKAHPWMGIAAMVGTAVVGLFVAIFAFPPSKTDPPPAGSTALAEATATPTAVGTSAPPPPPPFELATVEERRIRAGETLRFRVETPQGPLRDATFRWSGEPLPGANLDSKTGEIAWPVPATAAPGPLTVRIEAERNADHRVARTEVRIAVEPPPGPRPGEVVTNSVGMALAFVPPGEFRMGEPPSTAAGRSDCPAHPVKITVGFRIGTTEVSRNQYERIMGSPPPIGYGTPGTNSLSPVAQAVLPADNVTYFDAVEFCRRLSTKAEEATAGRLYRLPTEAEWEYAARAGTVTPYGTGEELRGEFAHFRNPSGLRPRGTVPVGTKKPNPWGLYDMHGNVAEWCADWYAPDAYGRHTPADPTGPVRGWTRVVRGGSWTEAAEHCRSSDRHHIAPDTRDAAVGFRILCLDVERK